MADVAERMLVLLSTLQAGRPATGADLSVRLGVSARTVRRDIDRLRGYGYPIEARPGPGGRYRLTAGSTVPPIVFDDGEAVAAMVGLTLVAGAGTGGLDTLDDAASRASGKLDQLLPSRLRPSVAALRASLETAVTPGPAVPTAVLTDLAAAISAAEVVRFDYVDQHDRSSARRVEPHRQVLLRMRWYLLGWDLERDDWRVFRLDRVSDLRRVNARFGPRPLPAETAVDYLRDGMHAEARPIDLVVRAAASRVADVFQVHRDEAEICVIDDATTAVRLWVSWPYVLPQLARLDAEFTVVAPADVAAAMATFAGRLLGAGVPVVQASSAGHVGTSPGGRATSNALSVNDTSV